ncbi:unnamed protein product [Nesidiocoris tenuis]|uniref:Ubiquitin-protein ligase E3C n=2 Tax=Nesidiocoris tenuis TaxID=355587 RepID=A0A6H5HC42_9HEMI|nr:ubiquitin protein ligase [Nesidiocoris tenuis]CAB0013621.1 unnamed protein product [Nesidiocoris tenuis]
MYSFEGNYRRRPQQNLAGASRQADKSELLTRALLERQKRQNDRRRVESAVKIQSAARGFLTRRRLKRTRRAQFDDKIAELRRRNSARFEADDVFQVLNRVPYICEPNVDRARVTTANVIVKSNVRTVVDSIREGAHTLHPLRTLMYYNLKIVADTCDEDESTIEAVDALKMFTSAADLARGSGCDAATAKSVVEGVFSFLVQKRYFESILRLVGSSSGLRDCFAVESVKIVVDTIVRSTSKDQRVNWLRSFVSAVAAMPAVFPALRSTVCKIEQWKDVPFEDLIDALLQVRGSSYNLTLLYFVLSVDGGQVEAHCRRANEYFMLIFNLTSYLIEAICEDAADESTSDDDEEPMRVDRDLDRAQIVAVCKESIFKADRADDWAQILDRILQGADTEALKSFTACLLNIWLCSDKTHTQLTLCVHLTYNKEFIRALWHLINTLRRESPFSEPISLVSILSRGLPLSVTETKKLVPLVTMFSYILNFNLSSLTDEEFHSEDDYTVNPKPFKLSELLSVSKTMKNLAVGIIVVAYPDLHTLRHDQCLYCNIPTDNRNYNYLFWTKLHDEVVSLVVHLRDRDLRFPFTKEGHWYSSFVSNVSNTVPVYKGLHDCPIKPFRCAFENSNLKSLLTTHECRILRLLSSIPFIVPFMKRVEVLQNSTDILKMEYQSPDSVFPMIPNVHHRIRRNYIYEDAFEKLSVDNVPELKRTLRIQLVNTAGLEEAGVDGGGVSREFLAEFMKTAFDPNRGFFVCNNNNELYPNPNVSVICSDFEVHYEFIGRMLGKAIYENILVDVPLAEFFLSKMVGKNFDQCLNSLASIDPDLYRNITKLRQYKGDFAELGLDFTLSINEYGQRKVIALKENGADIAVTRDNVNEYIALVAGYKLHVEVARQCKAFIRGLNMVVPVEWLEMFTSKELQVLISGKDIPIDVDDLKNNTVYTGGYSVEDPTIVAFWNVVGSFSDQERSQLIKFVTSHSRPPLLGFKELHPKFCIQKAAGSDRLPTASTCMNLLKLSTFESEDTLREKLIYAIQAGTGFELS